VKKTGEYVGTVTEEGLVPKKAAISDSAPIVAKEYGASAFLISLSDDILGALREHFPANCDADSLYALALLRAMGQDAFKRMESDYLKSCLSDVFPHLPLGGASLTSLLARVGRRREGIVAAMGALSGVTRNIIVDGSRITSWPDGMTTPEAGHNSKGDWSPQVNVMYVFERAELPQPIFYRTVRGSIPDVSALQLTMEDMGRDYGDFTAVLDAGFASGINFTAMAESGMQYIAPLKRNTAEVTAGEIGDRQNFSMAFAYRKRSILAYEKKADGYRIIVFRDEYMRANEMADLAMRLEKKNDAIEESAKKKWEPVDMGAKMLEKDPYFGTIILRTNMDCRPREVYETYKMRVLIEQCFDTLKNTLGQDRSYMHNDEAFEAWCFINHLALILAYRVLNTLKAKSVAKKYSMKDAMSYLSKIEKVKIGQKWVFAEYTKYAKNLCAKLGFVIQ
jgi:hypothetical protein